MSKVVIIGVDGLDPFLLSEWKESLPNFRKLCNDDSLTVIDSTFPPDSICAWTSIYTGENPAEHGLIESIDYLSGKLSENKEDRSVHFKGRTFWDTVSSNGKKVCVINPFIAYPAWKVNGIMVSGPVFEGGKISAYPDDIPARYKFPPLGGIVDFPDEKNLQEFIDRAQYITEQLADVSLKIYNDQNPELFFLTFLTLDRIKHFLWRFADKGDPYYPGENTYKDAIKDFYILIDTIIGKFISSLARDTFLLIISDHGHRRRCSKCLNLNEIFRIKGFLVTSGSGVERSTKRLIEKTKSFTISALSGFGLHDWIYKIAKFIPNRKALKKATYLIDKNKSSATLSNLCGTNPYGGIDIKAGTEKEYEKMRDTIMNELMDLNNTLGKNIIKWVKKREQVYRGKFEKKLPSVLFELNEEYGIGMDLYTKPITPNYTHKKISGGHKREAVLLVSGDNGNIKNIKRPDSIIGIKDYILNIIAN